MYINLSVTLLRMGMSFQILGGLSSATYSALVIGFTAKSCTSENFCVMLDVNSTEGEGKLYNFYYHALLRT